jgi:hypothetical protein
MAARVLLAQLPLRCPLLLDRCKFPVAVRIAREQLRELAA